MSQTMSYGTALTDEGWPDWLRCELAQARSNGCVGTQLVSETDRVRVWTIRLAPGERTPFHTHVLDYFWTALTAGRARSHHSDGSTYDSDYAAAETQHESYGAGEFEIHDLENIGTTDLLFTTVEFLDGENAALTIPDAVRAFGRSAEAV